jgi:hypothetical protein
MFCQVRGQHISLDAIRSIDGVDWNGGGARTLIAESSGNEWSRGRQMYLGIDLGSSSVKCVLLNDADRIVDQASASLDISRPHSLWSEQDPEDWWLACDAAIRHGARYAIQLSRPLDYLAVTDHAKFLETVREKSPSMLLTIAHFEIYARTSTVSRCRSAGWRAQDFSFAKDSDWSDAIPKFKPMPGARRSRRPKVTMSLVSLPVGSQYRSAAESLSLSVPSFDQSTANGRPDPDEDSVSY